ncbi:hypothetical protein OUZ56_017442 [Daphnia magna]|uniref:Uncharacterized protein n=1 Tax=Daphnia magna TaxID=35525 RepID=A0ABR0ASZ9_9CRUS|nr:hypothetical protein OUZ56_017442 [Daphnia magna]
MKLLHGGDANPRAKKRRSFEEPLRVDDSAGRCALKCRGTGQRRQSCRRTGQASEISGRQKGGKAKPVD